MNDEIINSERQLEGKSDGRPGFALTWEGEDAVDVLLLAASSLESHEPVRALQFIEAAIKLDSNWLPSYLAAGKLSLKHRNVPEAIIWFQKGLEIAPDEAMVYDNLSKAYYEGKDLNKALLLLSQLIELQPNNPGACLRKIRWLGESKKWKEIDEFFRVYKSPVQESGEAILWRCLAMLHLGRTEEARLLFEGASIKSKRQRPEIARQIEALIG